MNDGTANAIARIRARENEEADPPLKWQYPDVPAGTEADGKREDIAAYWAQFGWTMPPGPTPPEPDETAHQRRATQWAKDERIRRAEERRRRFGLPAGWDEDDI